ncbi:MAG: ABC transporter permease [Caulobacteraceae bacterium]|nr:ABC transporter permease [Caulobacteraceae bacterium]
MRRLFLIARREYFAYTRTVGFWLSMLVLPGFILLGGMLPAYMKNAAPTRNIAIVDLSGQQMGPALKAAMDKNRLEEDADDLHDAALPEAGREKADALEELTRHQGLQAGLERLRQVAPRAAAAWKPSKQSVVVVATPPAAAAAASVAEAERALRPLIDGDGRNSKPLLDGAVILTLQDGEPAGRFWSKGVTDTRAEDAVRDGLIEVVRGQRLRALGVSDDQARRVDTVQPALDVFSTRSGRNEAVGLRDRLPGLVGFAFGMLLWSTIITGASILMNSVMEEKSNRVLEVLLSSASTTEILGGKVLGVAGITATVLGVWTAIGAWGLSTLAAVAPGIVGDFVSVLTQGGLIFYLLAYLVGGYLMYAFLFTAVGAFCETPREAQTLLGPIMIMLSAPIIVLQLAIRTPDMPLVKVLSWVPLFTPFLMPARIPSEPPLWEIAGTMLGMALMAAVMVWIGGKAFRAGALATGKLDWKNVLAAMRGERS